VCMSLEPCSADLTCNACLNAINASVKHTFQE
jgi:pyrimidine deaminase RibD-like protein